jgi:hypothetical protein
VDDEDDSSLATKGNRKIFRNGNRIVPLSSPAGGLDQPDFPLVVSSNDSSRRSRRRHNRHRHHLRTDSDSKREKRKRRKKLEQERRLRQNSNADRRRNVQQMERRQRKRHNERSNKDNTFPSHQNGKGKNKHLRSSNPNKVRGNEDGVANTNNSSNLELVNISNSEINNVKSRTKKKQRNRRWFSVCDAAKSGVDSDGDIRLIEKCSWPQCNKSCPKLLNPITGEEVDFKDLLKSFGLDMGTMAKALGIDLATLNNMDHQVLLQMLTQHA